MISAVLTVSGEELPEVYGDHHPVTEVAPVAPHADVQGARARLAVHATEVKRLAREVIRLPALPLISREPEGGVNQRTSTETAVTKQFTFQIRGDD